MSSGESRRDIRKFEKNLNQHSTGGPGISAESQKEDRLLDMLMSGGPELPAAKRRDSLKASFIEGGTILRKQMSAAPAAALRVKKTGRISAVPALARYAAAAGIIILLLASLGIGSAYAMPGNPLYSVKRAVGSAYLFMTSGDQSKADAYASYAEQRLDELEYTENRNMAKWYYPLYRDAQDGIENTFRYGKKLGSAGEQEAMEKAAALTLRLENMLGKALNKMTTAEQADAERQLQRLRLQLNISNGTTPGPSQQDTGTQNQNRQQGTSPNGSETQSGSEQQLQQQDQQQRQQDQQQLQQEQQQDQQQGQEQNVQTTPASNSKNGDRGI